MVAILEFNPSATAFVMRCVKYVRALGKCLAIILTFSIIDARQLCVARKYQRAQKHLASLALLQFRICRNDSFIAHARTVFKLLFLSEANRSCAFAGMFSLL